MAVENEDPHATLGRGVRRFVGLQASALAGMAAWGIAHPVRAVIAMTVYFGCFGGWGLFLGQVHRLGWSQWVKCLDSLNTNLVTFNLHAEGIAAIVIDAGLAALVIAVSVYLVRAVWLFLVAGVVRLDD